MTATKGGGLDRERLPFLLPRPSPPERGRRGTTEDGCDPDDRHRAGAPDPVSPSERPAGQVAGRIRAESRSRSVVDRERRHKTI